jgi:hypothetical protein
MFYLLVLIGSLVVFGLGCWAYFFMAAYSYRKDNEAVEAKLKQQKTTDSTQD